MTTSATKIERVRTLITTAQERAQRVGALADRYAAQAARRDNAERDAFVRMARVHRQAQQRHLAVIDLHSQYLARLQLAHVVVGPPQSGGECADTQPVAERSVGERPAGERPTDTGADLAAWFRREFTHVIAERAQADHLGLALLADGSWVSETSTSEFVQATQDLEFTLGEGPIHDAVRGVVCVDDAETICRRWQFYGPDATERGIRCVRAAPICAAGEPMGSLVVLNQRPAPSVARLRGLADEVALSLLLGSGSSDPDDPSSGHPILAEADCWGGIHQATGVIAHQRQCHLDDALALLRARAYADAIPITQLAEDIISGEAQLD